jgi:hypothetical protein
MSRATPGTQDERRVASSSLSQSGGAGRRSACAVIGERQADQWARQQSDGEREVNRMGRTTCSCKFGPEAGANVAPADNRKLSAQVSPATARHLAPSRGQSDNQIYAPKHMEPAPGITTLVIDIKRRLRGDMSRVPIETGSVCFHCDTPCVQLHNLPASVPGSGRPVCHMCFIRLTPRSPLRRDRAQTELEESGRR